MSGDVVASSHEKPHWNCLQCSFANHPDLSICEICEAKKEAFVPASSSNLSSNSYLTESQSSHGNQGAVGGNALSSSHQDFVQRGPHVSSCLITNDNDLMSSLRYHSTSLANLASLLQVNNRHTIPLDNDNVIRGDSSRNNNEYYNDPSVVIMMPASALPHNFSILNNANFVIAFPSNVINITNDDSNFGIGHSNDNQSGACCCRWRRF